MGHRSVVACLTLVLVLFGCGVQPSGIDQQAPEPPKPTSSGGSQAGEPTSSGSDEPREPTSSGGSEGGKQETRSGKSARLLKTGFGQSREYAWVTSLVENQAEDNIGKFVTVEFNLLDSDGKVLASAKRVDAFSRADQKLAVGTQLDIPDRGKVTKVAATMEISDRPSLDTEPFPEITTGKVKVVKSEYGGEVGRVLVNNPTDKSLKTPRVGVICLDAKRRVIGGGAAYAELIPPSGQVLQEVNLITSGKIERCDAYAGPDL